MRNAVFVATVSALTWWSTAVSHAQEEPEGPVLFPPSTGGDSIRRPGSGRGPETPGDPGGWQQLMLLGIVVVALLMIAFLVRRQIMQAQRLAELDLRDHEPADNVGG